MFYLIRVVFEVAAWVRCLSHGSVTNVDLSSMAVPKELVNGCVRLSRGIDNVEEELDGFITALDLIVSRLKELVSLTV